MVVGHRSEGTEEYGLAMIATAAIGSVTVEEGKLIARALYAEAVVFDLPPGEWEVKSALEYVHLVQGSLRKEVPTPFRKALEELKRAEEEGSRAAATTEGVEGGELSSKQPGPASGGVAAPLAEGDKIVEAGGTGGAGGAGGVLFPPGERAVVHEGRLIVKESDTERSVTYLPAGNWDVGSALVWIRDDLRRKGRELPVLLRNVWEDMRQKVLVEARQGASVESGEGEFGFVYDRNGGCVSTLGFLGKALWGWVLVMWIWMNSKGCGSMRGSWHTVGGHIDRLRSQIQDRR